MATGFSAGAYGQYRELARWELVAVSALFGLIGITAAAASPAWPWLLTGLSVAAVAAAAVVVWNWRSAPGTGWLILAGVLGAAGWIAASGAGAPSAMAFAVLLPFAVGVTRSRSWWPWTSAAVATLGIGMLIASANGKTPSQVGRSGALALILLGCEVVVFLGIDIGSRLMAQMDRQRREQNELAITRERLRFANELHDVQGHTLLAIKLKAELARRSLERQPDVAQRELAEIESLVAEASAQTRQIAHGYRTTNLPAELGNLEQLVDAAGIRTSVAHRHGPVPGWEALFATLVREGTTNLLRHANPTFVDVAITASKIAITNDGAPVATLGDDALAGTGLESLRERFTVTGRTATGAQEEAP